MILHLNSFSRLRSASRQLSSNQDSHTNHFSDQKLTENSRFQQNENDKVDFQKLREIHKKDYKELPYIATFFALGVGSLFYLLVLSTYQVSPLLLIDLIDYWT